MAAFDRSQICWDSDLAPRPDPRPEVNGFTQCEIDDRLDWSPSELVIAALQQENAELREALASVRSDVKQYRSLLSTALAALHVQTQYRGNPSQD